MLILYSYSEAVDGHLGEGLQLMSLRHIRVLVSKNSRLSLSLSLYIYIYIYIYFFILEADPSGRADYGLGRSVAGTADSNPAGGMNACV